MRARTHIETHRHIHTHTPWGQQCPLFAPSGDTSDVLAALFLRGISLVDTRANKSPCSLPSMVVMPWREGKGRQVGAYIRVTNQASAELNFFLNFVS